jgi:Heat induced stress protein YflT domain
LRRLEENPAMVAEAGPLSKRTKRRSSMTGTNAVVAVYETHADAEKAVKELQRSGFDMKKLSVVGKEFHTDEQVVGYYNAGDRMKYWGEMGAFWGGLWGLLFGAAFFWVPGVGQVLVAGPLAAWIVGALEGAVVVGGLSVLGAGLYSIGIRKNSVLKYETAMKADKYLLVAHGTAAEAARAKDILRTTGPSQLDQHTLEAVKQAATA